MKIDEKFNKRSAQMLEVQPPTVRTGKFVTENGVKVTFYQMPGADGRTLSMDMSPDDALSLAEDLIAGARAAIQQEKAETAKK